MIDLQLSDAVPGVIEVIVEHHQFMLGRLQLELHRDRLVPQRNILAEGNEVPDYVVELMPYARRRTGVLGEKFLISCKRRVLSQLKDASSSDRTYLISRQSYRIVIYSKPVRTSEFRRFLLVELKLVMLLHAVALLHIVVGILQASLPAYPRPLVCHIKRLPIAVEDDDRCRQIRGDTLSQRVDRAFQTLSIIDPLSVVLGKSRDLLDSRDRNVEFFERFVAGVHRLV